MSNITDASRNGFFGRRLYILLSFIAAVPIYLTINAYVRAIGVHEDEQVSFAAAMCFIAGVFAGRYVALIVNARSIFIRNWIVIALVILIVLCLSWLFFHADFPLQGRVALNLLLFWLPFVVISLALGVVIKTVRTITQNQLKEAQVSAAHNKSELHLLQSQLSPHFLFNTLNNLYGLSITQHEKVPVLLLKLADLLRYSVYEANEIFVPLKDELTYISNYIDFEKIRIGDRLKLIADIEGNLPSQCKIAPMLLIVFIENAFKHSKNTVDEQIFIEISLKTWENLILFSVKNSYGSSREENMITEKNSGFGLASVSKRLELLYHNAHELNIQNDEACYKVMLQLKMK